MPSKNAALALLENARVASPCSASWEAMTGDERVRFCARCSKHVYDLSAMPPDAAAALVGGAGAGRLCVRFYRRADGTFLAGEDCPVGLAAARRRLSGVIGRAAAVLIVALAGFAAPGCEARGKKGGILRGSKIREMKPFSTILGWIDPDPYQGRMVMGEICPPTPPPAATTTVSPAQRP